MAGWASGIGDQQGFASGEADEPALRHGAQAAPGATGLRQHGFGRHTLFFPRAVEQREATITMTQRAQGIGGAFDDGGQHAGHRGLSGLQQRADFDQILQRHLQLGRAALDMHAIGQELLGDFLRQ